MQTQSITPVGTIKIDAGNLDFTGSVNYLYVGEYANTSQITVYEEGYVYGGVFQIYAINESTLYFYPTTRIGMELQMQNSTVYWQASAISNLWTERDPTSILYVEAVGPGNFSVCGQMGTTIVESNITGPVTLSCAGERGGDLNLLHGDFIIYANQYSQNIKVEGSLVIIAESYTIGAGTEPSVSNVSILIPEGGVLNFENSYYIWADLPWPVHWNTNSSISLFESSIDFGTSLTLDEGRQIIFAQESQYNLISIIKADEITVTNTSSLWFQAGRGRKNSKMKKKKKLNRNKSKRSSAKQKNTRQNKTIQDKTSTKYRFF
eukprot:Phypoly_transcript_04850.p1 GENE.Phypoly_transcript_04850~~Phypoly_transcript_04850.p1  ORF type:complete len:320 (+),score=37.62 Phypoly_transcript_04850:362-1321(+)